VVIASGNKIPLREGLSEGEAMNIGLSASEPLKLTPKIHPQLQRFLEASGKVRELVDALGSPLNVLFPQRLKGNMSEFYDCFKKHNLLGKVFFAHKSNSSQSVVRELATLEEANIDVSSVAELRDALSCGFVGSRILATGPKCSEFLTLSLMHDITLSVDSLWEISEIISLRKQLNINKRTKLLLRVSGFQIKHSNYNGKASRYGISLSEIEDAFDLLKNACESFLLLGFAFHIDTVSVADRALAIENCFNLFELAFDHGFEPTVLDIGGGFKVNYLDNENDWNDYATALREATIGNRKSITWQGNSFGLTADKGIVRGSFNSYAFYDPIVGAQFLEEILSYRLINLGDSTIGSFIRDNGIELWIEPGLAILDQTGITLSRVVSLHKSSQGDELVCLQMKRQDLCFVDREIFVDPVILYQEHSNKQSSIPVYFAGNLCLESDLVYRHQTFLPALPQPGDIVAFVNTAGYFMDFSASEAIMQPIARKIAVFECDGKFGWTMDDQYQPLRASE
jgi:diaminopimelate decarboxylase